MRKVKKNSKSNQERKLKEFFYLQDTVQVARKLLGKKLVRISDKGERLSGLIVETEAYLGTKDAACHSYKGKRTSRTESMYLRGGHAYIYLIYGMYHCFNVVTREEKNPESVLIRSLMPLEGMSTMIQNRFKKKEALKLKKKILNAVDPYPHHLIKQLTNGPGKLTKALNITKKLNQKSLLGSQIYIEQITRKEKQFYLKKESILTSSRIGLNPLAKEAFFSPLRFFYKNNIFVSTTSSHS